MKEVSKIRELTARLNQWRDAYYNHNAPTVSDAVYDRCFDELKRLELETGFHMSNSPTQTVGYEVVDGLEKTTHAIPLLSLDKTKQVNDIFRFIGNHQVMLMHKLDGLTVKLEYENGVLIRASTRGNGDEGEVITHNARAVEGIPAKIPYKKKLVVVGEAYIPKPAFKKLKDTLQDGSGNPYKNARNMAAGSIRSFDAGACAGRGVVFSPFSVIDGIVAAYDDIPYSRSLGRTGHRYKDGLAFKFADDLYETVLRGIEWTPSRSGEIAPVALFDTVEIDGCEVSRASFHNLTFIKQLELMPGCRIFISKRNMIIPHVEENLDRGHFKAEGLFPKSCPCCGKPTRIDTSGAAETLHCDNPSCDMKRLRQFVHFVSKKAMDIESLSEATLEKFIGKGWLHDFTDIYHYSA